MKQLFVFLISVFFISSWQIKIANAQDVVTIQETEDNIITGAKKLIYNDSILALIDVSKRELFVINRDGSIVKKITPEDSYSDSITVQSSDVSWFNNAIKFKDLQNRFPKLFKDKSIDNYYIHEIYDCTFFDNYIGYTSLIATFVPETDTTPYFSVRPLSGFVTETISKSNNQASVDFIKLFNNSKTQGTNELFYYGKFSNTFLSDCLNESLIWRDVNLDTVNFDSLYRFTEYNRNIEPIKLVQSIPKELASREISFILANRVTQTSDSAFWSIGNYHDMVYNLKDGSKFQLNTPGNTCSKFIEQLIYYEFNNKDSLRYKYEEFAKYLNYEVLSLDATPEDDLIFDLLHAVMNKKTGKKEQYHILQKYSRSGELLGEKVFPQDGKLGNLQRIAYSAERDEFAFLIFKDEKWLLAYSKEDKVW